MDKVHYLGIGGDGPFCVVSAFGGPNVDGEYCWPLVVNDVKAGGQSMAALYERGLAAENLWSCGEMFQQALKQFAASKEHLIGVTRDDGCQNNEQRIEVDFLRLQPGLSTVHWFRYKAWVVLVASGFSLDVFQRLVVVEMQFRTTLFKKGDRLHYVGRCEDFKSGNQLTYGQAGKVIGSATLEAYVGKGLKMDFPGNQGIIEVTLDQLSPIEQQPLPGGHVPRSTLFYTGANQTLSNGDKLTTGVSGMVLGPATMEPHVGNGLKLRFPGNKGWVDLPLDELSIAPPKNCTIS